MRRSILETKVEILSKVSNNNQYNDTQDMAPTHIMLLCNLSWKPMKEYINDMVKRNLLMRNNGKYRVTAEGFNVLDMWKQITISMG